MKRAAKKDNVNEGEDHEDEPPTKKCSSANRPNIEIDQFTIGVIRPTISNLFLENTQNIARLQARLVTTLDLNFKN